MNEIQYDKMDIDLKEIISLLLGKLWLIILVSIICASGVALYTMKFIEPEYSSTATLFVNNQTTSIVSLSDVLLDIQLARDYEVLATSRTVVDQVIKDNHLDLGYEEFVDRVSVYNPYQSRLISISFVYSDPELAKEIVDDLAKNIAISVARIMDIDVLQIVDTGNILDIPISPDLRTNTIAGAFFGGFVTVMLLIVIHLLRDTYNTTEEIEKYLGVRVLASIPNRNSKTRFRPNKKDNKTKKKAQLEKKTKAEKQVINVVGVEQDEIDTKMLMDLAELYHK